MGTFNTTARRPGTADDGERSFETNALHAGQEPDPTTHQQLTEEERLAAGVKPDMVQLPVGTEGVDDTIAAIEQAS